MKKIINELTKAMAIILQNSQIVAQLKDQSALVKEKFSWQNAAIDYLKIFRSLS